MSNMKKWNYIIVAVVAAIGAGVIALSAKFPITLGEGDPGPGFWPMLLGGCLILTAVILLYFNIRHKEREESKTFALTLPGNLMVYRFMGLTVAFCVVMYVLGLLAAAFLFIPVAMYMMGARGKMVFIIDVVFILALYVIFMRVLHTPFPEPIWMR